MKQLGIRSTVHAQTLIARLVERLLEASNNANPVEGIVITQFLVDAQTLKANLDLFVNAIGSEPSSDALVNAIRNAESLGELKRLIGPSQEEEQRSIERLAQIEAKWQANVKAHGEDPSKWPSQAWDGYNRLMAEQTEFENQYC
jgi:hypothetical protein